MALVLSRALLLTCVLAHARGSCCAGHHPHTRKRTHAHTRANARSNADCTKRPNCCTRKRKACNGSAADSMCIRDSLRA
eukprot:4234071-Lingulodinium_polyedra.AAC.1